MALSDAQRTLRTFKRFTGDGLPTEPVNAPLPVGDPSSGLYQIKREDLRQYAVDVDARATAAEVAAAEAEASAAALTAEPYLSAAAAAEAAADEAAGYAANLAAVPYVSPTSYGASTAASAATNAAALVSAAATGKHIVWPAGIFNIDPVTITLASTKSFRMSGHSQGGTRLAMASGGIKINTPADRNVLRPEAMSVSIENITFLAKAVGVDYAIWINWPTWSSITIGVGVVSTMGRSQKHRIANCSFGSYTSVDSWDAGIRLSCVSDILIDDCIFTSQTYTGSAILFDRLDQTKLVKGTNNKVRHCTVQGWDKGIEHIAPGEGLLVSTCSFVCNYGVYAVWQAETDDTSNPQVQIIGGHANCTVCGYYILNFGDLHISNALIYTRPPTTGVSKGIYISNSDAPNRARAISITNNVFRIPSGGADSVRAIELGAKIGLTYVDGNIMSGYSTSSIVLSSDTRGVRGENIAYNSAAVTNLGANNTLTLVSVPIT